MLRTIVLGSAAGGGFPQWNCSCRLCALARAGDPRVSPRTQASIAVSADGEHWLLVGASPDLPQQLARTPALHPRGLRHSPIFGVVLVNAEVDGIAGLLSLRERHPFTLWATRDVLDVIDGNGIFDVLGPSVRRCEIAPDAVVACGHGLQLQLRPLPGKQPLHAETDDRAEPAPVHAASIEA
ncbi:MAG: pyrroloquinoline quinone biosynthesis protein B, partial [Gluconacetobacter diazotrophicus]|nr:pyrroloquinoline quinone biosynthesis protein B [Gluconacetobacter diazotrophicus]